VKGAEFLLMRREEFSAGDANAQLEPIFPLISQSATWSRPRFHAAMVRLSMPFHISTAVITTTRFRFCFFREKNLTEKIVVVNFLVVEFSLR